MLQHKLRFFTVVAAIIAFAPAENEISAAVTASPAKCEMPAAVFLPVQSKNLKDLSAGKLLVASRDLGDPNFVHTVLLLVRFDAQGVVGLVLNRRTDVTLSRVFEGLKVAKDRSDRVYIGGPVDHPAVFALLQSTTKPEGAEHVVGGTYLIATKTLFEQTIAARPDPGNFHVYLGYAGWAKEQLRMEVAQGAWFIFPADPQTIFSSDPDSLWQQMIRKTELKLAQNECVPETPVKYSQLGENATQLY
jgi:putative transcriptional regulator